MGEVYIDKVSENNILEVSRQIASALLARRVWQVCCPDDHDRQGRRVRRQSRSTLADRLMVCAEVC